MGYCDWKPEYSVGIEALDEQHRRLNGLINDLFESLRDGREEFVIGQILGEFTAYAEEHFALEAALFQRFGFPDAHDHVTAHRFCTERIRALRTAENVHRRDLPIETLDYLKGWFEDHELNVDSEYAKFFGQKVPRSEMDSFLREYRARMTTFQRP